MSDGPQGELGALPIALIIAPAAGRLKMLPPKEFRDGREWVEKGQPVAQIEHGPNADPTPVEAPARGWVGGVMGRDGEPVRRGQPVAWMEALPGSAPAVEAVKGTA